MSDPTSDVVILNDVSYEVSPLRCKHLKEISRVLSSSTTAVNSSVYGDLDKWSPYVLYAVQKKNPEFTQEMLDEATFAEFLAAWIVVINNSGIKVVTKGEPTPAAG